MWGTLINASAIVAGSVIGTTFNKSLPERYQTIVFQGMGLFVAILGIAMAMKMQQILLCVCALLIGGLIGELLRIDRQMLKLGDWLKRTMNAKNSRFSEGFVTASLLYCIGAMAILGSIEEGNGHHPTLLLTKAVMDGFSAVALAAAMGIGVMFSAGPVVLYQGLITLAAVFIGSMVSPSTINELSAVGGILLVALGINLLDIKKIQVVNFLPSLAVITILTLLFC